MVKLLGCYMKVEDLLNKTFIDVNGSIIKIVCIKNDYIYFNLKFKGELVYKEHKQLVKYFFKDFCDDIADRYIFSYSVAAKILYCK